VATRAFINLLMHYTFHLTYIKRLGASFYLIFLGCFGHGRSLQLQEQAEESA